MKYGFTSPSEDELKMPDEMSDSSDDSFEIVSAETCEGLDEVPISSYKPLVTFQDMFDVYPIDSDIVARVSLTGGYVKSTEDTVMIMPIAWTSIDQAFHAVQLGGNFVKFDVKNLPKTPADKFYQLCYASNDKTIVGVSAPFSFREVHEDELIEFQKEQNKEFWTFRSRFAVLMNIYWNSLVENKRSINFKDLEVTSHETAGLIGHVNSGSESSLVDLTKSVNSEALSGATLSDNDLVDIKNVITENEEDLYVEVPGKAIAVLKPCASMMSVQQWKLVYDTLISVEEAIQFFETQMKDIHGAQSNSELFAPVDQRGKSTLVQEEEINGNKFVLRDLENNSILIKEEETDETPPTSPMHLSEKQTIETSNLEKNESLQAIGFVCSNQDIRRDQIDMLIKQIMRKKMVLDQVILRVRSSDLRDLYLKKVEKIYQLEVDVQTYKARTEELECVNASLNNVIKDGEKEKMAKDDLDCAEAAALRLEEILISIPNGFMRKIAVNAIQNLCECIQILKENALSKKKWASAAMKSIKIDQEVNLEDFEVEISIIPNEIYHSCALEEVVSDVSLEMSGSKNCKESIPERVLQSSNSLALEQIEPAYIVSLKTEMAKLRSEVNNYQKEHLNLSKKLRDTHSDLDYFKQLYQKQLQEKNEKDEAYGAKLAKFVFEKEKILIDFKKMKDDYEERLRQGAKEYAKLYLKYQKYSKPSDHTYAASGLVNP